MAQENADGEVLWALTDHQNSVRVVLDNNGNIVNQISYDSFGGVVNETNSDVDFRFGYTGRELDAETGLHYYRARYYDSNVGRFISEDPISFAAGDSNIYRYVGNNPLFYVDPSGFCGVGSSGGGNGDGDGDGDGEPEYFGPAFGPNSNPNPNGYDISAGTIVINPKSALATAFAALAATLHLANETSPETQRRREEFDEFIRNQGDNSQHPVEQQIEQAAQDRQQILDDLISGNQPSETTVGDNTGDLNPNNINRNRERDGQSQLDFPTNTGDSSPANRELEGQTPPTDINADTGITQNTGSNEDNSELAVDRFDVEITNSNGTPVLGPGYTGGDAGSASDVRWLGGKDFNDVF